MLLVLLLLIMSTSHAEVHLGKMMTISHKELLLKAYYKNLLQIFLQKAYHCGNMLHNGLISSIVNKSSRDSWDEDLW